MIIEKFDFRAFFNTKNITNHERVRNYGIGAVSVITPMQAITRINAPDNIEGILGLGEHTQMEFEIAKIILGIKKEKSCIPEELYVNEDYFAKRKMERNYIKSFLKNVVIIEYTSSINGDFVAIKLPTFGLEDNTAENKPKISDEMYEGLNEILTELENSGLSSDSIKIEGVCSNQNYEQIKQALKNLVDSTIIFPFEENIIVKQQFIQDEGEFEKD